MNRIGCCFEQGFVQLTSGLTGSQPRSDHPLEAADKTFSRPPPPITRRQALRHDRAPATAHTTVSPMHCRSNPTADAGPVATPLVHPFGIVARVGIQLSRLDALMCLHQQLPQFGFIIARPPIGYGTGRHQRAHHHAQAQFHIALASAASLPPRSVVAAGSIRVHAGGVQRHVDPNRFHPARQLGQQPAHRVGPQPVLGEAPQGRIIRRLLQSQRPAQIRRQFQQRLDATPIQLAVFLQQDTAGQLGQRESARRKFMRVARQHLGCQLMCQPRKPQPVLGRLSAPRIFSVRNRPALSTRFQRAFQQSKCTYDRANIPKEVEKLYEITGAYLEWFIPKVDGHLIAHTSYGGYSGSQAGIGSFHVASAAPIAVSSGVNGIQVRDLKKGTATPLLFLKKMPKLSFEHPWNPAAISPDGKTIAYASDYATFAADWTGGQILWETNPLVDLESGDCLTKKVAIGGDKGQFLFVAGARKVERCDLATGKHLATLATSQPTIQFLETSRDGKTLVAGFNDAAVGGCITAPTSITVWKSDENIPSAHIETHSFTGIGISPDGPRLALSIFGQKKLLLWDWHEGVTNEVPFRTPYGSSRHAYAMFWSPDKTRFAAYVDTYPASIVVYDALNWKPLAHWKCGQVMSEARFDFADDGQFVELRDHDLTGLDVKSLSELK
jgi:hypothetical protein